MFNQNTNSFQFDSRKTLETLLYIISKVQDLYLALKILYCADQSHLSKYGRLIAGDEYIAMKNGAVPSVAYDIAKIARGDGKVKFTDLESSVITDSIIFESDTKLIPKRDSNKEYLSDSDIECLDLAIKEILSLNRNQLKKKFHSDDKAYSSIEVENDTIPLEKIITLNLKNGDEILEHLKTTYE